jgi:transposase-like protein
LGAIDAKHFHDEEAAFAYLEARLWPNGPVCTRCGRIDRIRKLRGKSTRVGVYKCYQCDNQFRVTVGTAFESSHVPLRLWLQAAHLLASSKKVISSYRLHQTLGVRLRTAWFMSDRIREAMHVLDLPADRRQSLPKPIKPASAASEQASRTAAFH